MYWLIRSRIANTAVVSKSSRICDSSSLFSIYYCSISMIGTWYGFFCLFGLGDNLLGDLDKQLISISSDEFSLALMSEYFLLDENISSSAYF